MSGFTAPLVGDTELVAHARRLGTPLYVYDLGRLRLRIEEIRSALAVADARLYFATMANDRPSVLSEIASCGVGACVNSIPHLELAQAAGFPIDSTQFTSTGVSGPDLAHLRELGCRVNLDSPHQFETWLGLGGRKAGIRINAASLTGRDGGDRIGIEAGRLDEVVAAARRGGGLVVGLHVYVGTNFQTAEEMLPTLNAFFDLAARVDSLTYLNIGGGIGVDYSHAGPGFDLDLFGQHLGELTTRLRERLTHEVEVISEPGRALAASCASFLASVTDVKELRGRRLAAVDASVAIFPRPLQHPESPHRIRLLARREGEAVATAVVGRTTYSRDVLGTARLAAELESGDLVCFDDAGAYCQSMASRFLGQPDPEELYLD